MAYSKFLIAQQFFNIVADIVNIKHVIVLETDTHVDFVLQFEQIIGLLIDLKPSADLYGFGHVPPYHIQIINEE